MTRFHDRRLASAAAAVALAAVALAGCGGDDEKTTASNTVATIAVPGAEALTITRDEFQRFYRAGLAAEQDRAASAVVPLEGPDYAKCVADAKKQPASKGQSASALKTACASRADRVRQGAVEQAVNLRWIIAEAETQGIDISAADIAATAKQLDATLDKTGGKAAFLKRTGFTQADLDLNARSGAAQTKVIAKVTAGKKAAAVEAAKTAFRTTFFDRWKAKTTCSAEFQAPTVCGKTAPKPS